MCSGLNPKRISEIRNESKPEYKIYCMDCGRSPPLCICGAPSWRGKD
jgi:hypothetical protein